MVVNNVHQAKTNLSKLLAIVQQNEEVIIAKAGVPVAKLVKYTSPTESGVLGVLKGKIHIADDFDSSSEGIEDLFYGGL